MSNRALKWLTIILPVMFWLLVLLLRDWLFAEHLTPQGDVFVLVIMGIGAAVFSTWVFNVINRREAEIRRRTEELAALHAAGLALTTELDLATVLQKVVDLSRQLVHARYGALGVLDEKGEYIDQFLTSGISPEERARLGDPPRGHGLLGLLIREGEPIRVPEIREHPKSVGFPPNHPPMHSLLGVPIKSKGLIFGDLYLTDKVPEEGGSDDHSFFTTEDQTLLEMFATQAAIAIENAKLYRQTQQLAILEERERFGMDLHDGIIQSIYAIGLMLEDGQLRLANEPEVAHDRISRAVHDLNDVIRDIRNYILDLRPQRFQGRDLVGGLEELTRDLRANTFLDVKLHTDSDGQVALSPEQTVEILHIVQETLTNVRKHARASRVEVALERTADHLQLVIEDNGVGLNSGRNQSKGGNGLHNMRERAQSLGADIQFEPGKPSGTRVVLDIPLGVKDSQ